LPVVAEIFECRFKERVRDENGLRSVYGHDLNVSATEAILDPESVPLQLTNPTDKYVS
jgi:hypothetical protein